MLTIQVNGKARQVNSDPNTPLLWVLRDELNLTGTKYGCGVEICAACTVWIDGSPEKSCHIPVKEVTSVQVTTIEGLVPPGAPSHPVQQAWIDNQVPQCGYCQSGMIMAVAALTRGGRKPTDAQIDAALHNICACGTYPRIRAAIHKLVGA